LTGGRIFKGTANDSLSLAGATSRGADFSNHDFGNLIDRPAITWGTTATNLVLKSSPALGAAAVWNQVPVVPILQNGRYGVTVSISNEAAYFRLQPP
jgi:hypothetical protein